MSHFIFFFFFLNSVGKDSVEDLGEVLNIADISCIHQKRCPVSVCLRLAHGSDVRASGGGETGVEAGWWWR